MADPDQERKSIEELITWKVNSLIELDVLRDIIIEGSNFSIGKPVMTKEHLLTRLARIRASVEAIQEVKNGRRGT